VTGGERRKEKKSQARDAESTEERREEGFTTEGTEKAEKRRGKREEV